MKRAFFKTKVAGNAATVSTQRAWASKVSKGIIACMFAVSAASFSAGAQSPVYTTVSAGAFNDPATWGGTTPPAGASVVIGHSVSLVSVESVKMLSIADGGLLRIDTALASLSVDSTIVIAGGSLVDNGGTVNLGKSGGDKKSFLLSGGSLTLLNGTVNVNGSVAMTAGNFTMTGGALNVDPNSGASATSIGSGKDVFTVNSAVVTDVEGGKITFVDPPYAGAGKTFVYTGSAGDASWIGSTMIFGGTSGINSSTATNGFNIDTRATGSSYVELGDVVVNGGSAAGRFVSGAAVATNGFDISGNLTINAGSSARTLAGGAKLIEAGNINNLGIYYDLTGIYFGKRSGPSTQPQYITNNLGKGSFRNSATRPTANFTNLEFNNSATPVAVTLNFGDGVKVDGAIFVSGVVAFTKGIVDIGTDNQFIFTISATATRGTGALLRGFGPGGGAQMVKQYPAGASKFVYYIVDNVENFDFSPVTVSFSANSYAGKAISISVFDKTHAKMNVGGLATDYISRYWRVVATPIGTCTAKITFQYLAEDVVGTESNLKFNKWDGTIWSEKTSTLAPNTIAISANETTLSGGTLAEVTGKFVPTLAAKRPEATTQAGVSVYPNPLRGGTLHFATKNGAAVKGVVVYNSNGQQVYNATAAGNDNIALVHLPGNLTIGNYAVVMKDALGKVTTEKVLVQ